MGAYRHLVKARRKAARGYRPGEAPARRSRARSRRPGVDCGLVLLPGAIPMRCRWPLVVAVAPAGSCRSAGPIAPAAPAPREQAPTAGRLTEAVRWASDSAE